MELTSRIRIAITSGAVGVAATIVDLASLTVLVEAAGLPPRAANVPALAAGVLVQFAGNKWLAFRDRSPDLARQGALFLLVETLAFALNAMLFDHLTGAGRVPYLPARVLVQLVVYFGFSLPLWSRVFVAEGRSR